MTGLEEIRRQIAPLGCRIVPFGRGWRIYGRWVDLLVADLSLVRLEDLRPRLPSD